MFSKNELQNFIVIDIETVSGTPSLDALSEVHPQLSDLWVKRCEYLRKKHEDNRDRTDEWIYAEKAGLHHEYNKIVCISIAYVRYTDSGQPVIKTKSYYGSDEATVLKQFFGFLNKFEAQFPGSKLCGHNIKRFDIPCLCKRGAINGLKLPNMITVFNKKPWEIPFIDTAEIWSYGSWQESFVSLETICTVLDIPSPKSDIDGSQVTTVYWNQGEKGLERIKTYCENDVAATMNVVLRLSNLEIASPGQIYSVV